MKIFKKVICLDIILVATSLAFGQNSKGDRKAHKEKIKAMKVSYITEKLNLTSEEAEKFWPIYNEYDAKSDAFRKGMRKTHKQEANIDEMTDADVEKMIHSINDIRQKELNLQKEYLVKFKSVLPIKKVAKLYKAEHGFKRNLLKKIKNHQGKGGGKYPGPPPH